MRKIFNDPCMWSLLYAIMAYAFLALGCYVPQIGQFLFNPYVLIVVFIIYIAIEEGASK